jgi:hypothetical protein
MKTFLFLILIFFSGCLVKRHILHDPHFYYDKESYTLIRVNPETREKDIEEFEYYTSFPDSSNVKKILSMSPSPIKRFAKPRYPNKAKESCIEPTIVLLIRVNGSNGVVEIAHLFAYIQGETRKKGNLNKIEELMVLCTLESAIQTTFYPERFGFDLDYDEHGKPQPVWLTYPVRYVLH